MEVEDSPVLPHGKLDLRDQLWPPKVAPRSDPRILERFHIGTV